MRDARPANLASVARMADKWHPNGANHVKTHPDAAVDQPQKLFAGANRFSTPVMAKSPRSKMPSSEGKRDDARFNQWLSNGQKGSKTIS